MKWYFILIALLAGALLAGCSHQPIPEEEDGGTRHFVEEDVPKAILSTQIVTFSCEFSALDLDENSSSIAGRYYTLYAGADGGRYEARADGEVFGEREFTPDAAFFHALQEIVSEYDLAQFNGQHYTVSGLPPDYGARVNIQYESGESIQASDNQNCFIPLEAMEELVVLFQ